MIKLKSDFSLCEISGKTFLVPIGAQVIDMRSMFDVNETGEFILRQLKEGALSNEDLLSKMIDEYEVEEKDAESDLEAFINDGIQLGFLEEE